jgi:hypothetical protein
MNIRQFSGQFQNDEAQYQAPRAAIYFHTAYMVN